MTIIIPAYNAERFLGDAIRSAQNQRHHRLEILVINDGSTDATGRLSRSMAARDPRICVVDQANEGLSSARNEGLRRAQGEYLCFLDSDDVIHPLKIARQLVVLEQTGSDLAFCDYVTTDVDLIPLAIVSTRVQLASIREQLPFQNVFPPHAALVRRSAAQEVGFFDERLKSSEDWDYWIRSSKRLNMVHVPGALCSYRNHEEQMHRDRARMRANQMQVIQKNFEIGSPERRIALACLHWSEAKHQYIEGHRGRMLLEIAQALASAGSPIRAGRVIRFGRYG